MKKQIGKLCITFLCISTLSVSAFAQTQTPAKKILSIFSTQLTDIDPLFFNFNTGLSSKKLGSRHYHATREFEPGHSLGIKLKPENPDDLYTANKVDIFFNDKAIDNSSTPDVSYTLKENNEISKQMIEISPFHFAAFNNINKFRIVLYYTVAFANQAGAVATEKLTVDANVRPQYTK